MSSNVSVLYHAPEPALCFPDVVVIPKLPLVMLTYYRDEPDYEPTADYAGRNRATILVTLMGCRGFSAEENSSPDTPSDDDFNGYEFAQVKKTSDFLKQYRTEVQSKLFTLKHFRLGFIDCAYNLAAEVCSFEIFSCERGAMACLGGTIAHGKTIYPRTSI